MYLYQQSMLMCYTFTRNTLNKPCLVNYQKVIACSHYRNPDRQPQLHAQTVGRLHGAGGFLPDTPHLCLPRVMASHAQSGSRLQRDHPARTSGMLLVQSSASVALNVTAGNQERNNTRDYFTLHLTQVNDSIQVEALKVT